jgi:hypothetical protein
VPRERERGCADLREGHPLHGMLVVIVECAAERVTGVFRACGRECGVGEVQPNAERQEPTGRDGRHADGLRALLLAICWPFSE